MKAIAAISLDRVIGCRGQIPWHLREDLRFFKQTTMGHILVMGRKTYESIGRALPGRETIVLTRGGPIPGVRTVGSPDQIVEPGDGREVFVAGGAEVYSALLPRCSELLLTLVRRHVPGDAHFPAFEADFEPVELIADGEDYEIRRYRRRRRGPCAGAS